MKNIILKSVIITVIATLTVDLAAHRTGHPHRHGKKVIHVHKHHAHPVATVAALAGIAMIIDKAGNAKTDSGQPIVVLDSEHINNGKTEVIERDGVVYIIN